MARGAARIYEGPFQPRRGQGAARRGRGLRLEGRGVPRRQPLGADLRHDDRLAGPERQFGRGDHRRDAHFADHGPDHGCRPRAGHQRFRTAQEVAAQPGADVHRRHHHLDGLFLHLAALVEQQRAAGAHRAYDLRRADRPVRRPGGHRGADAAGPHVDRNSRRGHRHGPHPAPLYGGLRTGHGAVPLFHRRLLPLFHQFGVHRAGDLCHGAFSAIREEGLHRQGPRAHGQAADDGHHAGDLHPECRHRVPHGPRLVVRGRGRQIRVAGLQLSAYPRDRVQQTLRAGQEPLADRAAARGRAAGRGGDRECPYADAQFRAGGGRTGRPAGQYGGQGRRGFAPEELSGAAGGEEPPDRRDVLAAETLPGDQRRGERHLARSGGHDGQHRGHFADQGHHLRRRGHARRYDARVRGDAPGFRASGRP